MDVAPQKPDELVPTVTVDELDLILTRIAAKELSNWSEPGLVVRVFGRLRGLNERLESSKRRQYSKVFAVTLLGSSGAMAIDMGTRIAQGFQDGDYVEVIGFPTANVYKGNLTFRLELISMRHCESSTQLEQRRQDANRLEHLKSLKPGRNSFPLMTSVKVSVIHSRSGKARVDEDFSRGLGDISSRCEVTWIPVRITSAEEIAAAVAGCNADILVIIRGGGDDEEFSVFEEPVVLEALAASSSYRILGVGHSANATLADLVCDFSASVPSAAGTHIRDQFKAMARTVEHLEGELARRTAQVRHLKQERDSAQATRQSEPVVPVQAPKPSMRNVFVGYAVAAVVGMAVCWVLLR